MSTTLLYHAFGHHGCQYKKTDFEGGEMTLVANLPKSKFSCSSCKSSNAKPRGSVLRQWRTLPIGGKPVHLEMEVPRIQCNNCGSLRVSRVQFASPRKSYTKSFERYVIELLKMGTILDVANHLQISWHLVKTIQKENLQKTFGNPDLKDIRRLAIDEISIGKQHNYLTVALDLDTGAVVYVGDGKGADSLTDFWNRVTKVKANIEAVAVDMSPAYTKAVSENLPGTLIVYDHFHVIKLYNDRLSDLRRSLYREVKDDDQKKVLKGTRWLLLKNNENLDPERDERDRLQAALDLNKPLATAYYMKEELKLIWSYTNKTEAEIEFDNWVSTALQSEVDMLVRFAKTMIKHKSGILAFYDCPISTGPLEGTNNKIKTMQRQAYGYRDKEFFKLKIYAIHKAKHRLVG